MLQFVKTGTIAPAARQLSAEISAGLDAGKRVLWLVSGGSAIQVAVQARKQLPSTDGLMVMQADERFGPPGHPDSNWRQLLVAGFDTSGLRCAQMLGGSSLRQTAYSYNKALTEALRTTDVKIGLFGVGADGHTAGILPGSPAIHSPQFVTSDDGPDFQRITMTPAAIARLNLAIVYASGSEKTAALKNLQTSLPLARQPAQALKAAKATYVYNEVMEGSV